MSGKLDEPNSCEGRSVRQDNSMDIINSPTVSDDFCTASLINNYIKIDICGLNCFALCDTGADISVACPSIIDKLERVSKRVVVEKSDKAFILTADNSKVNIIGIINVPVLIGKETAHVKFYLVPGIEPHVIIGMDFLKSKGAVIDFVNKTVTIDKRRQLIAQTDVTVPPRSEVVIVAKIKGTALPNSVLGISTESPCLASQSLLAAKSLSQVRNGTVIHGLCNLTDKPIRIQKNTNVGKFVCLSDKDKVFNLAESCATAQDKCDAMNREKMNETFPPIGRDLNRAQRNQLIELLQEYDDVFVNKDGKLGNCGVLQHEINISNEHKPIRQRPYKIGNKQKQVLENMVNDMLNQEIIEPSTSAWAAPCLLVSKKNSSEFRFVVDYRRVNDCISMDAHPLITTDDALESLGAAQPSFFSVCDLRSGFYQTQISQKSRQYTAWRCHLGLFQFRRLPMGLKNSPQMFQRLMETVLQGMTFKFCLIYLDDIIVYSKNFSDHVQHLKQVFDRLRESGLKLHPTKCSFAQTEIKYLGHIVSSEGIAPDQEKIDAISSYPIPRKLKDLRAFLGLSGYYRKFIRNYAKIATPLYSLTKKNTEFIWTIECNNAFEQLKSALTSHPILGYPDYDQPFRIYTDASSFSIGAVLCQVQNDTERVICYSGRALTKQEQNYGITELECLALVFAIKKFDCYLRFSSFTAYVDHSALKWLLSLKEPTGKFARWIALIQSYDFTIVYRPGSSHGNADGVSRRTYDKTEDETENERLLNVLPSYHVFDTPERSKLETQTLQPPVRKITYQSKKQCTDINSETDNLFTTSEIRNQQRMDNDCKYIISYLETGELPENKDKRRKVLMLQPYYFLHDDILYHVDKRKKRGQRDPDANVQLVIPRKLVPIILKNTHNDALSGHLGISRTIRRTQRLYYWRLMNSDIEKWIKSCELCSERKQPPNPVKAQIQCMPVASMPFERVSTDIMGPMPASGPFKYQYVLVFICYFTKYVELIPLSDIKASTVATAFVQNIICRHGSPNFLHSDRGSNYLSNIITETCKLLDISKTQTTSYNPQCNGQSERMMRSVKEMLSKYLDDTKTWHNYLPFIQFAYNTAPSVDTTDYTPFFLVHGRHPKTPFDTTLPSLDINKTAQEYIISLLEELEVARKIAKELLEIRKSEMLKKANRNRDNPTFKVGDIVYLYKPVLIPGLSRKLNRPWTGPFYISEKLSDIHVKLRRKSDGKQLKNRIHVNRLKRGYLWINEPYDNTPPNNEDAIEPCIIAADELPADNIGREFPTHPQNNDDPDIELNDIYSIEKILRKKKVKGKWTYRVKWVGFDAKDNSWVAYDDLTPECRQYVTDMHHKIPTVKR